MNNFSLKKYLAKSFTTGIIASIGTATISLYFVPLLIGNLGAKGFGIWTFLAFFTGISGLGEIGISKAIVLLLNNAVTDVEKRKFLGAALATGITLALIFSITTWLITPFLIDKANANITNQNTIEILRNTGSILIFTSIIGSIMRSIFEARLSYHKYNVINFITITSNYCITWAITQKINSINIALITTTTIFSIGLVINILFAFKNYYRPALPTHKEINILLKKSLDFFGIGIINIILLPINRYFVTYATGMEGHGIFDIAIKISQASTNILSMISVPLYGVFAKYNASTDLKKNIYFITKKVTLAAFIFYITGIILFNIIGEQLCSILSQTNSNELFEITLILLITLASGGVAEACVRSLWATNRTGIYLLIRTCSLILNIILIYILNINNNYSIFINASIPYGTPHLLSSFAVIITFKIISDKHA
jgi:O-antigen/teichoic acid export membrane protein